MENPRLTRNEFIEIVETQPSWATTLTQKTFIVGRVILKKSPITHLSPYLWFTRGKKTKRMIEQRNNGTYQPSVWANWTDNMETVPATKFENCPNLKRVAGTFEGAVIFDNCGIEEIDPQLNVIPTGLPEEIRSITLQNCKNLKTADFTDCQLPLQILILNCPKLITIRSQNACVIVDQKNKPHPQILIDNCPQLINMPEWFMHQESRTTVSLPKKIRWQWHQRKIVLAKLKSTNVEL